MWLSRDPILKFWDNPNISRTVEARNSNLAWRRTAVCSNDKHSKLGQKGSCGCHVTQFWNFGTPLISHERLKLETSNLARRRMAVSSYEINSKLGQKGSCEGQVTQFWNFGTPLISRERLKLEASNLAQRRKAVSSNKKNQNWVKKVYVGVT